MLAQLGLTNTGAPQAKQASLFSLLDLLSAASDGSGTPALKSDVLQVGKRQPRQMALVALTKVRRAEDSGWPSLALVSSLPSLWALNTQRLSLLPWEKEGFAFFPLATLWFLGGWGWGAANSQALEHLHADPRTPACRALEHQHADPRTPT